MSYVIQLDAVPNQEVSATLDGRRFVLTVKDCGGCMGVSITRDGVTVCDNVRAVAGFPLLNHRYQEDNGGNFIFTTAADDIPYYTAFGLTQELIYTTNAELEEIRNG